MIDGWCVGGGGGGGGGDTEHDKECVEIGGHEKGYDILSMQMTSLLSGVAHYPLLL